MPASLLRISCSAQARCSCFWLNVYQGGADILRLEFRTASAGTAFRSEGAGRRERTCPAKSCRRIDEYGFKLITRQDFGDPSDPTHTFKKGQLVIVGQTDHPTITISAYLPAAIQAMAAYA